MNAFDEPGTPLFLFWGSLIVIFSVTTTSWIIYTSASLIRFVHMTERRMDPYNLSSENNREKTKETTKQAILYTIASQAVIIPTAINMIGFLLLPALSSETDYVRVPLPNWYWVVIACIKPWRGFLSSVVYFRPKYNSLIKRDGVSAFQAIARVLELNDSAPIQLISSFVKGSRNVSTAVTSSCSSKKTTEDKRASASSAQGGSQPESKPAIELESDTDPKQITCA